MSKILGLGKVKKEVFNRCVLPYLPIENKIELDGAITSLRGKTVIAHSPSIGVPIEALGFFAFHYSASNVASKFGKPRQIISGIYLPLNSSEKDLRIIAKTLGDEARKYGVSITAGQTATYYGLSIPLLTTTCIGSSIRNPIEVHVGDRVILVGAIGGEAVWLDKLSKGEKSDTWRCFTPLPTILSFQKIPGIKLMHDVSEGGVIGALYEVATINNYGLKVFSENIELYPEAETLKGDIMKAPTYGALIVIVDSGSIEEIKSICIEQSLPFSDIGLVISEPRLIFDDLKIIEQERINLDEIYGSFTQKDSLIDELKESIDRALELKGLFNLIPEVGINIVYAKPKSNSFMDVVGLSGRIIKAIDESIACGNITYGASKFLSSVVVESQRIDPSIRAAINIKGGDKITNMLKAIGLDVHILPSKVAGEGCPVTIHLKSSESLHDAYIHPGDFGIEPTTTILGPHPKHLIDILEKLIGFEK